MGGNTRKLEKGGEKKGEREERRGNWRLIIIRKQNNIILIKIEKFHGLSLFIMQYTP